MTAHRLSRPDGCLSAGSRGGRTADLAQAECSTSAYGIRPAGDRQFLKQRSHVGLDRIQGQDEIRRDLLIGTKIRQQREYLVSRVVSGTRKSPYAAVSSRPFSTVGVVGSGIAAGSSSADLIALNLARQRSAATGRPIRLLSAVVPSPPPTTRDPPVARHARSCRVRQPAQHRAACVAQGFLPQVAAFSRRAKSRSFLSARQLKSRRAT